MSRVQILHNRAYRGAVIVAEIESEILIYQIDAVQNPVYVLASTNIKTQNSEFIKGVNGSGYVRTYHRHKLPKKWIKEISSWDN